MEAEATGRALRLAGFAGAPLFVVHVSCRTRPRRSSAPAPTAPPPTARPASSTSSTRSTTCAGPDFEGARYVCSPPLRDASNQPHLWDALRFDHLQIVSTDHCPFNDEQKRLGLGDFSKIPNGLAAIQHGCRCSGSTACARAGSR